MGGTIGTHQPRTVNRTAHRWILQRRIMHDLITPTLKKIVMNRNEWLEPAHCSSGGKSHAILLYNSDVKHPLGLRFLKNIEARKARIVLCGWPLLSKTFLM